MANVKASDAINNPDVKASINEFVAVAKKKISNDVVDETFTPDKLASFYNHAVEDDFFDGNGKRLVVISGKRYDKESLESLIKEENEKLYGDQDVKEKLDKCRAILSKSHYLHMTDE